MSFRFKFAYIALGAALLAGACVSEVNPVTGQKQQVAFKWAEERQLGGEADKDIIQEMGLLDSPELQNYVTTLGNQLLERTELRAPNASPELRATNFTFRVLNSPVVNAFAIPGGYVYVTRGLLSHVQNESQLALVLGHEIGHVTARHSAVAAARGQKAQLGMMGVAILGSIFGEKIGIGQEQLGQVMNASGQAMQAFLLKYDRNAETEADTLGVRYAHETGYATAEGARFFRSLERLQEGKTIPSWQSSHPDPGDRAQKLIQLSAPGGKVEEEGFLRRIDGMVVGENPREGFVENGVFFHPELRFQFPVPGGWDVQNETAVVILADPRKGAALGFQLAPGSNAQDAASQFAQKSGIQVVSANNVRIGGKPGTIVIGQGNSEQGQIAVWSAFVEMDGRVYNFMGQTSPQALSQYQRLFESVVEGLAPVRDNRILSIQPSRLRLVRVSNPAPFSSFVPRTLPKGMTAQALAIMNQVELNETIPAGRFLKIPGTP